MKTQYYKLNKFLAKTGIGLGTITLSGLEGLCTLKLQEVWINHNKFEYIPIAPQNDFFEFYFPIIVGIGAILLTLNKGSEIITKIDLHYENKLSQNLK